MILIFSQQISNRLRYSCNLIFNSVLKVKFKITNNSNEFKVFEEAKLNYSNLEFSDVLQIKPVKLLFEDGFQIQETKIETWRNLPVFFKSHEKPEIPFDLFALSFYLASRYEEYNPSLKLDKHQRFQAEESLAYQNGFHLKPLVNLLCFELQLILREKFPDLEFEESQYKFKPSFDIDTAFDYLGKGVYRTIGAYARDLLHLNFHKISERSQVLVKKSNDPFDNFKFIIKFLKDQNLESQFFVNLGDYGLHDKNTMLNYPLFKERLQEIDQKIGLGIHPSYKSNKHPAILKKEIERLEQIKLGSTIKSRQHYLILNLPETYRTLIELGIKEDYSMGYASQLGFRASMCSPYKFYDLLNEEETDLMIFPFCYMDGTFTNYLKLNYDEILAEVSKLRHYIAKVNGLMMGIWHNSFISNNKEMKSLFKDVLTLCK